MKDKMIDKDRKAYTTKDGYIVDLFFNNPLKVKSEINKITK